MRLQKILIVAIRVHLTVCLVLRVRLTRRVYLLNLTATTFLMNSASISGDVASNLSGRGSRWSLIGRFASGYSKRRETKAERFLFSPWLEVPSSDLGQMVQLD